MFKKHNNMFGWKWSLTNVQQSVKKLHLATPIHLGVEKGKHNLKHTNVSM